RQAPLEFPLHCFSYGEQSAAEPFWLQHQESPGRRGCAQSNPAAAARDCAAAPGGDTRGMGHRDSSEKFGGESAVRSADGGFFAVVEGVTFTQTNSEKAREDAAPAGKTVARDGATLGVKAALFALQCYKAYLSVLFAGSC